MSPPRPQDIPHTSLNVGPAPTPRPRRTADGLVDVLTHAGVDLVFGLPGGPDLAVVRRPARSRQRPGGADPARERRDVRGLRLRPHHRPPRRRRGNVRPGVLNAITGLASAHCDGLPVLLLVGELPRKSRAAAACRTARATAST